MKKSLKSQITMIMIAGIAIFIVITLFLYLSKSAVKKQTKQNIKQAQEISLELQPIREFVSSCLDKAAKDAVILLGKQGGYIYKSQGGTLIDYKTTDEGLFFIKHKGRNVVYNILQPSFSTSRFTSKIPDYPWPEFPYTDDSYTTASFNGYFGISNLPPLESSKGPHSIQAQMESFIDSNIDACMDFNIFRQQGYDIKSGISNTTVIIGGDNIRIASKIPISIKNAATKESAELTEFSASLDIRLNNIYYFVNELIRNEIENIRFNISDAENMYDSFEIGLIKNAYVADDVVIITDKKSFVAGSPYQYLFARKNRAPALYYLKGSALQFPQGHLITEEEVLQGSKLQAEDPDEDEHSFSIRAMSGIQNLPKVLDVPQLIFKVEVRDGQLKDYQNITVERS